MNKEIALLLKNPDSDGIIENYPGRGMNEKPVTGVVFENHTDIFSAIAEVLQDGFEEEQQMLADALHWIDFDHYGTGIIYY